jgi:hypothetical protein
MTIDYKEGFAEGFKAGWEAAQSHFRDDNPVEQPSVTSEDLGWGQPSVPRPDIRDPRRTVTWGPGPNDPRYAVNGRLDYDNMGNPWTAHERGLGGLTGGEQQHFVSGLSLHTEEPLYEKEDVTMHNTTRVL